MKKLTFLFLMDKITQVCGASSLRLEKVSITAKILTIGIMLIVVCIPFTSSAQLPFVIHMPFHGEPLFCHETACIRKAAATKKIKKSRHKRRMATRKASKREKDKNEKKGIDNAPVNERLRPKFE